MRFLGALLSALSLSSVYASTPIPYTNCGTSSDLLNIQSASANVWPPVKGQEFDVTVNATLAKDIKGGNYHIKVSFDFIPILDKTGPYSDLNVTLPIKGGPVSITKGLTFPSSVPSGYADITVSATDEAGTEVTCIEIKTTLSDPKPTTTDSDIKIINYNVGLANVNVPYKDCGNSTDVGSVVSLMADVWPPVKGQDVTLFINGNAKQTIADGNYDAAISWDGIPIYDDKGALSSLGITVPVAAGPVTAKKTITVPASAPAGAIEIVAQATDTSNNRIFCVDVTTSI